MEGDKMYDEALRAADPVQYWLDRSREADPPHNMRYGDLRYIGNNAFGRLQFVPLPPQPSSGDPSSAGFGPIRRLKTFGKASSSSTETNDASGEADYLFDYAKEVLNKSGKNVPENRRNSE